MLYSSKFDNNTQPHIKHVTIFFTSNTLSEDLLMKYISTTKITQVENTSLGKRLKQKILKNDCHNTKKYIRTLIFAQISCSNLVSMTTSVRLLSFLNRETNWNDNETSVQ